MEYQEFAKYYDIFYQNKDYEKEASFLKHFINKQDKIIDVGCGTGIHGSLLEKEGYYVDGLDLSPEMLKYAKKRIHGDLYQQDILKMNIAKKYNIIISMFAVINHLQDTESLKIVLKNFKNILLPNGKIIIDLHNPSTSGSKIDFYGNLKRTMKWHYDDKTRIEKTDIMYEVNNNVYYTSHTFKIFTIDEIVKITEELNLNILGIYEDYSIQKIGNSYSKNLQFIISNKK